MGGHGGGGCGCRLELGKHAGIPLSKTDSGILFNGCALGKSRLHGQEENVAGVPRSSTKGRQSFHTVPGVTSRPLASSYIKCPTEAPV